MMRFVFVAELADGRTIRESETVVWDQVPDGIRRLILIDTKNDDQVVVGMEAKPKRRFFFHNEGIAAKGEQLTHSGKIIGLIDGKQVHEYRLDFGLLSGRLQLFKKKYPVHRYEFDQRGLRKAA
jgi:hypothetical protein